MWDKIITIKRTKCLNYFSLCGLDLFNTHVFHNLSWITEINELFHDILIWDAAVNKCMAIQSGEDFHIIHDDVRWSNGTNHSRDRGVIFHTQEDSGHWMS